MSCQVKHNRHILILIALISLALVVAWHNRFVQDDAFISFEYARNLIEGKGLTWFGTRVEGYSNFLWVLWIALGLKLGVEPVLWSYVGGISSFVLAVYATWKLSLLLFEDVVISSTAVLMLISNYTISSYATGGLETMLQTALVSLAVYILYRIKLTGINSPKAYALLSLLLSAAVLTRLDSIIPVAITGTAALAIIYRRGPSLRHYLSATLPFILLVGGWSWFNYVYYGRLLPNSYYAKIASNPPLLGNGLLYIFRFFHWYLLWPLLVAGVMVVIIKRDRGGLTLAPLMVYIVSWYAYVVYVGGDFMEFRFMVPASPFLFILLAYLACNAVGKTLVKNSVLGAALSIVVMVGASIHHARTFRFTCDNSLDSIQGLSTYYNVYDTNDWDFIGKALKNQLDGTDATLAVGPVGAIPYYSGLRTIDIWGLNDLYTPTYGYKSPPLWLRPGHRCLATVGYLKRQKANFVLDFPFIENGLDLDLGKDQLLLEKIMVNYSVSIKPEHIDKVTIVAMPLNDHKNSQLLMWYLVPSKRIDEVIKKNKWRVYSYIRSKPEGSRFKSG